MLKLVNQDGYDKCSDIVDCIWQYNLMWFQGTIYSYPFLPIIPLSCKQHLLVVSEVWKWQHNFFSKLNYFLFNNIFVASFIKTKGGFGGGRGGRTPSLFFAITCFFLNHFEKPKILLFEVEMISNNALLTYASQNTIETCVTLNQLLFGRQLLIQHQLQLGI